MTPRIATVLEIEQDVQASRNPARGILAVANAARGAGAVDLTERVKKVAAVAAAHAAAVDRDSRFPAEAIAAARAERLMGIAVPRELGGEGASISDVADVCYALGRACASTAMIYAMHQTKVACLVRHGTRQRLASAVAAPAMQRANAAGVLDHRRPERRRRAQQRGADRARAARASALERQATVISYGEAADGIVTTARRSADAASADQVLVVFLKQDYTLEPVARLGRARHARHLQRRLQARRFRASEQILPVSYDRIHAQTMMPVAHLFWSAAWAGIAAAAVDRARAFVRKAAQRAGGTLPPAAAHLTRATRVAAHAARPDRRARCGVSNGAADAAALESIDFQTGMNLLKVNASELAVATVMSAMQACGSVGLSQRRRVQPRPPSARYPVLADHDQQRPHPRQHRRGVAA